MMKLISGQRQHRGHARRRYCMPYDGSAIIVLWVMMVIVLLEGEKGSVFGFRYRGFDLDLPAPGMTCISGTSNGKRSKNKSKSNKKNKICPCPTTAEEANNFHAVLMDDGGYVEAKLIGVRIRDDGRRRHGDVKDDAYYHDEAEGGFWDWLSAFWTEGPHRREMRQLEKTEAQAKMAGSGIVPSEAASNSLKHHIQIYLVSLDDYAQIAEKSQCCYELESPPFPSWISTETIHDGMERPILPTECTAQDPDHIRYPPSAPTNQTTTTNQGEKLSIASSSAYAHDYRANVPRHGKNQRSSPPMEVNAQQSAGGGITIHAKFRPTKFGRHMLVISNCAAELTLLSSPNNNRTYHHYKANGLKAVIDEVDVTFTSKFGELPMSMMGIIPFYGMLCFLYSILATVWWKRSSTGTAGKKIPPFFLRRRRHGLHTNTTTTTSDPPPLLGLQRAIRCLVFSQTIFSALAFSYYLHLNRTAAIDANVIYSGTAAVLLTSWHQPWSLAVAMAHFITVLACQIVVTLATDGTWLIQHGVRTDTRCAILLLIFVWIFVFLTYGLITSNQRACLWTILCILWVFFLLRNVRRSLQHLRAIMISSTTTATTNTATTTGDSILAADGAIAAKQSLYRKMCIVVAIYPVVFLCNIWWNSNTKQDTWQWIGYVLVDVYLFVILVHASIIWIPRPMASQEYIKYAPLEVSVTTNNDLDLWEESIREQWHEEEEIELQSTMKLS